MKDRDEFIFDTGTRCGSVKIYYDKAENSLYTRKYVWYLDKSQEFAPEAPVTVDAGIKMITANVMSGYAGAIRLMSEI